MSCLNSFKLRLDVMNPPARATITSSPAIPDVTTVSSLAAESAFTPQRTKVQRSRSPFTCPSTGVLNHLIKLLRTFYTLTKHDALPIVTLLFPSMPSNYSLFDIVCLTLFTLWISGLPVILFFTVWPWLLLDIPCFGFASTIHFIPRLILVLFTGLLFIGLHFGFVCLE